MTPYYSDEAVTIWHRDARADWPVAPGSVACVVTSPPYNVGIDYGHDDLRPWPDYWTLADAVCGQAARALADTGRAWVNVPPVVQSEQPPNPGRNGHSGRSKVGRASLLVGWGSRLEAAGLPLCDIAAWVSQRGSGTAWGSWQSPSAPNLRGDWEAVLLAYKGSWPRTPPAGLEPWKDTLGGWPSLVTNVWDMRPQQRADHPAPFPEELPARAVRLSTWPGETVLDPFMGSGSTLAAAKALGRKAVGVEVEERFCEIAAKRLAQGAFDFGGVAS